MGKKLRVLSIGHSYVVAMNRSILREIANDEDFEVSVVPPRKFHGSLRTIQAENEPQGSQLDLQPVDAYFTQKMHVFAYDHFQLSKVFRQDYDLVHVWEEPYIFSGFQLARLAHKTKKPFCFFTNQSLVKKYPNPFRQFEKKVFSWATRWIACGQLVYEAMAEKGWDVEKSQVLAFAVDTDHFRPFNDLEKKQSREMLGLEGPVIGFLGRLTEEKGWDLLMEALTRLKDKTWSLLVMGSGPYEKVIRQWAEEEGLEDRVKVRLYSHQQIPNVLPVCDLLVCPSQTRKFWKEQFGRMIVEAFAAGVPVVGSDSGEIPYVIGQAGRVLPEKKVDAWVEAIEELLSDQVARNQMREAGLQRANVFSAKTLAAQYKDLYREMLQS